MVKLVKFVIDELGWSFSTQGYHEFAEANYKYILINDKAALLTIK